MVEKCSLSYLDNEILLQSTHHLANELIVQIEDPLSNHARIEITVYCWAKISQFKDQLVSMRNFRSLSPSDLRLFHKNIEMNNQNRTLLDYNISNGSVILVQRRNKIQQGSKGLINPYKLFAQTNAKVSNLIKLSANAIDSDIIPTLSSEGTSGVYMIRKQHQTPISIFKPFDEEVNAPNNPRGREGKLGSEGIFKGILSGQCATREVAAYLLDADEGFHGVPTTTYVEFYHPTFTHKQQIKQMPITSSQELTLNVGATKHGSLQQFVQSDGLIGDYGSKRFTDHEIHKIGILDIRILNCDRNQQNILVKQVNDNLELIPIDHGLSLPDNFAINQDSLLWMSYPQSKRPFTQEQLSFIEKINPMKDAEMLQSKLGFRQICLRNFRIAEIFLKKAAAMGFTLYEIGKMLYRTEDYQADENGKQKRSSIQSLVFQAESLYLNALESIQKQNIEPQEVVSEQFDDIFEQDDEQSNNELGCESPSNSTSTCGSVKSMLMLRKKVSLPQLKKKDTSFHELRSKARKEREGINGISKTIWNKYHQDQWNELFYYYFHNLVDTLLTEKSIVKQRKNSLKVQASK